MLASACLPLEAATPIRFAGQDSELVISEVGKRTVRVELPAAGQQSRPESSILVGFPGDEKLRVGELESERELRVGGLRVTLNPNPLTVAVHRADGTLVQQLIFDERAGTNSGVSFRTESAVLGLGEGAQQFDRRGAFYPMEATWGGWNRPVLGSVVPSPFLIGTDGWAILAHQPEGRFDLRDGRGRFLPRPDSTNDQSPSLDLFVIALDEPGDALAEYIRLTGRPVMPPKWALGYFQSHRTLAGPHEPMEIARAFREKKLPCDALIYLGTGYCTNGWNTGHGSLTFNTNAFVPENIAALHNLNYKVVFHVNRAPRRLVGSFDNPPAARSADRLEEGRNGARGRQVHIRDYWARHRELFALGVDGWWPDDGDELPLEARLTRHR
jgi:alpha-glucosidase/alpha-D-xyloside xylohydrolase